MGFLNGMKNQAGVDVHAFVLTVLSKGQVPPPVQVGNPVPPAALAEFTK
jgi:hypothetical protein